MSITCGSSGWISNEVFRMIGREQRTERAHEDIIKHTVMIYVKPLYRNGKLIRRTHTFWFLMKLAPGETIILCLNHLLYRIFYQYHIPLEGNQTDGECWWECCQGWDEVEQDAERGHGGQGPGREQHLGQGGGAAQANWTKMWQGTDISFKSFSLKVHPSYPIADLTLRGSTLGNCSSHLGPLRIGLWWPPPDSPWSMPSSLKARKHSKTLTWPGPEFDNSQDVPVL